MLIWGAGLQGKLVRNLLKNYKIENCFIYDDYLESPVQGIQGSFISNESRLLQIIHLIDNYSVAIGNQYGKERHRISSMLQSRYNLNPLDIFADNSYICETVKYETPLLMMPGSLINSYARIGRDCIINTGAIVEHEVQIGDGVHIMPGAVVAGCVLLEDFVTIGANATLLPGITIGQGAFIGAGSVVTKDVTPNSIIVGNPGRPIRHS